jgi:hypothetical protein
VLRARNDRSAANGADRGELRSIPVVLTIIMSHAACHDTTRLAMRVAMAATITGPWFFRGNIVHVVKVPESFQQLADSIFVLLLSEAARATNLRDRRLRLRLLLRWLFLGYLHHGPAKKRRRRMSRRRQSDTEQTVSGGQKVLTVPFSLPGTLSRR